MNYHFQWDPAKARRNVVKHNVAFQSAATVFRDANQLSLYDDEHSDYEDRWITLAVDQNGHLLVVIHTFEQSDLQNATLI